MLVMDVEGGLTMETTERCFLAAAASGLLVLIIVTTCLELIPS